MDNSTLSLWERLVQHFAPTLPAVDHERVIAPLVPIAVVDHQLVVEAPNRLTADVIRRRYLRDLEATLHRLSDGSLTSLVLHVRTPTQQELFPSVERRPPRAAEASVQGRAARLAGLYPPYTFENFVVGAGNQFAHAAAKAVATQPGDDYNPLFIYGGVGLGKTHLINAIGHQILAERPDANVLYLSANAFMNELIAALRRDRMDQFEARFRRVDVLLMDDVQFLAGRERTQDEFFHTFNRLYQSRRQIVLTSDKFPKEIPELEERLRNRFVSGLIADIQPPDMETRVAILEKKAETEGIALPEEVAIFLASQIDSNIRELEGSLTRLAALASMNRCPITIDLAREAIKPVLRRREERSITVDLIQRIVADFFHLRATELRAKRRTRNVALPRQIAMYLCRRYTDASFPVIGDRFGGRDHSTVIHATQVVEQRLRQDPEFRATIERLQRLVEDRSA